MIVRDHFDPPKHVRRILVIQLGDIGDIVWTVPALLSFHAAYPEAALSLLVHRGFGGLIGAEPYLDKVFEVPSAEGGLMATLTREIQLIRMLRQESFDWAIDLRAGDRGAFMAYLSGAPTRSAMLIQDASFLRHRLFTHLVRPINENIRASYGAAEQTLRIIRGLGIPTVTETPKLHISNDCLASVKRLLSSLPLSGQNAMITINPFSRWSYKEWNADKWAAIVDWLISAFGYQVAVIGSASERSRAETLIKSCSCPVFNAAGETTLGELAALLSLSRLHIGVDSAAPHIAAAVGTPTLTIYGPSDWRDWAPVGEDHRVIVSSMDCVPCHQKGCPGQGKSLCLESLSVDQVKEAIRSAVSPRR